MGERTWAGFGGGSWEGFEAGLGTVEVVDVFMSGDLGGMWRMWSGSVFVDVSRRVLWRADA